MSKLVRLCCVAKEVLENMGLKTATIKEMSSFDWHEINTITDCLNVINEKNHKAVADNSFELVYGFDEDSLYGGLPEFLIERLTPADKRNLGSLLQLDGEPLTVLDIARTLTADRV